MDPIFRTKGGDTLRWQFVPSKNGKLYVKLEPISMEAESTGKDDCMGNENAKVYKRLNPKSISENTDR